MRRSEISVRTAGSSSWRRIIGLVLPAVLVLTAGASWAEGQAVQPAGVGDAKTTPLSHYVPRQDLLSYLEFGGLDAHQAAWQASAARKILNETKLGVLLEDLLGQYFEMSQQGSPPEHRVKSADILAAIKLAARQGFVLGVWGKDPDKFGTVLVVRGGDQPELRRMLDTASRPHQNPEGPANPPAVQKAGRALHVMSEETVWWVEKGDMVLSNQPDAVLAVLDGKEPDAVNHPLRAAIAKAEGGSQPIAVGFLDLTMLPPLPPGMVELGLDGVKRIEFAAGFEGEALRTVLRAVAPAPRRGVLALLDQPTFDASSLPPLPAGLTGFTVLSIDLPRTYDQVAAMLKKADANGPDRVTMFEDAIRQQVGFDVRKDLIAGLGPKLAVYEQAPADGAGIGGGRSARMIAGLSGITIAAQVQDQVALTRAIEPLMTVGNQVLQNAPGGNLQFRKQEGARLSYILDLPPDLLPPPFSTLFHPTIIVGKDQFIVGASTGPAEKAANLSGVARDQLWQPTGAFVPVVQRLPANLVYLRIADPREMMPAIIESLPILAQQLNAQMAPAQRMPGGRPGAPGAPALRIDAAKLPRADELITRLFPSSSALVVDREGASLIAREPIPGLTSPAVGGLLIASVVPAVSSAREAARRAQCVNNLKQIGLAMHNYHATTNALPMPAIIDKDGKPLLSWRVAILPYIEEQALYNKFKLDEPWDSPNNKPLIKEMPRSYLCPSRRNPEPGTTPYQAFVGKGALFEEGQAKGFQDVLDGTSNTIMVVESKDSVPWSKPDDLKFDMEARPSLYGAASPHPGGFNVLFSDGSVRFIKNSVSVIVFKALVTRASGEVVSADAY